ncbi:hypothetical protein EGR_09922 [Echinococcus granulosus]|uniref:Uncharacterized protein n=1 Tax=Echinococcus granulosus TaxID=6210 RepID=W6UP84_ECHGR|nr:hypothetical protein EGR_09922 [Echinococcus granulosus]EUB55229.1 hypothetical protein EGR_09922 [Echinococcus granulosus]
MGTKYLGDSKAIAHAMSDFDSAFHLQCLDSLIAAAKAAVGLSLIVLKDRWTVTINHLGFMVEIENKGEMCHSPTGYTMESMVGRL